VFAIVILALGLAMDAVAVALVQGTVGQRSGARALMLGLSFGLAQGLMPLLGWGLGVAFGGMIEAYDHWVAFALLTLLGGRMLIAASGMDAEDASAKQGRTGKLAIATGAFATSIDAAAAGLALPAFEVPIAVSCLTIGGVTAVLCTIAYFVGSRTPPGSRKIAEAAGGVILIALGVKIVIEHTMG
jgi:putative Mn2+ efflux pump MntP